MSYKLYKLDYKSRSVEKPSSPGETGKEMWVYEGNDL